MAQALRSRKRSKFKAIALAAGLTAGAVPAGFVGMSILEAGAATGSVGGSVFRDFDQDGVKDATEPMMANLWVRAVGQASGPDGQLNTVDDVTSTYGPVKTDQAGAWTIDNVTSDGNVRVEFLGLDLNGSGTFDSASETALPSWLKSTAKGPDNGSSSQFVALGNMTVRYGVANPRDYVGFADPQLATTIFLNGDPSLGAGEKTLQLFSASGSAGSVLADGPTMGAAYGLAAQRSSGKIFAATYVKRHAGLWNDKIGQIFQTTASTTATPFVDVTTIGINVGTIGTNTARGLGAVDAPSTDADTFGKVGKTGIGDIEMGEDDSTMWLTNMSDGNLYKIMLPADGSAPTTGDVTNVGMGSVSCSNGTLRPMGLGVRDGKVMVGAVCDAATGTRADLTGWVLAYEPTSATWTTHFGPIALDYAKGCVHDSGLGCQWNTWTDTYSPIAMESGGWAGYPMPLIADVAFDNDGSMIVGFRDRFADMMGNANYRPDGTGRLLQGMSGGDLLRVCNVNGSLVLEGNPGCASNEANNQGPGGGEFYQSERLIGHQETADGAAVVIPGSSNVIATVMDPLVIKTSGVSWFSNTDGSNMMDLEMHAFSAATFSKSNGIGDLEAIMAVAPLTIGNRVWIDANADGVQDPSELPVGGVTVELLDGSTVVGTTTTDPVTGEYYFDASNVTGGVLPNKAYNVSIATNQTPLSGYTPTSPNASGVDDTVDSDGVVTGATVVAAITTGGPGANDHTIDFGFVPPIYDLGLVKVVEGTPAAGGNVTWTIRVKNQGTVDSGSYVVTDTLPSGLGFVSATNSGTETGGVVTWNLSGLAAGATIDLSLTASIPADASGSMTNWAEISSDSGNDVDSTPDTNTGSGSTVPNDPSVDRTGLSDVETDLGSTDEDDNDPATFTITPATTTTVATTTTTIPETTTTTPETTTTTIVDVTTTIADVTTTTVVVIPTTVAPEVTTTTVAPTTTEAPTTTTTTTTTIPPTFSVGNLVWADTNNDGAFSAGETGLDGVQVRLLASDGSVVSTQTTNSGGYYLFDGLAAGTYQVEIVPPASYVSSTGSKSGLTGPFEAAPGVDSTQTDSDDNGTASTATPGSPIRSASFVLGSSEPTSEPATPGHADATPDSNSDYTVDFGLFQPASLGDKVWFDDNDNGIQDPSETGVAGVTVELLDANGVVLATTVTDANGNYLFENLTPGVPYRVRFVKSTLPEGFVFTITDRGVESTDSNADPVTGLTKTYILAPQEFNSSVDAGIRSPKASLGDTVWYDDNENGVQDSNETGVAGVTVKLLNASGTVVATATTDANGLYRFNNLIPGVSYTVEFVKTTLPTGYVFTTTGSGAEGTDSNADQSTGRTKTYVLTDGEHNPTVDAGIVSPKASLGDTVWFDDNNNGVQDGTEKGVPNVRVNLLDSSGTVLATTTTDLNGAYRFNNLTPGRTYMVEFVKTTLPAGYGFTATGKGAEATDSNADPTTGRTKTYVLTAGEHNPTVDAGIYLPPAPPVPTPPVTPVISVPSQPTTKVSAPTTTIQGTVGSAAPTTTIQGTVGSAAPTTVQPTPTTQADTPKPPVTTVPPVAGVRASIGDYVWVDRNNDGQQDPAEKPIVGARVVLRGPNGLELETVTNVDGRYLFDNLEPGDYEVEILATSTPTNGPRIRQVQLSEGQTYLDADFGFTTSGVRGVQVQQQSNLAFTGAMSLVMAAVGLMTIGLGGLLVSRRRRVAK